MKKLLHIIFILSIISCEKVIPFDEEIIQPKLVINGTFQYDSSWRIHVSSSKSVIDSASFNNIVDASVSVEDNNGNVIEELIHDANGFYIGNTIPQENFTYYLSVNHPTLDDITCSNEVPSLINLTGIDTATSYSNGDKYLDITVNFEDPGNASNYYLVETYVIGLILEIENGDTLEYQIDTSRAFMVLTDEVFQDGGSPWKNQGLFDDLLFNGQTKSLEISIPNNEFSFDEAGYIWSSRQIGLKFYFYNISLDYYYYRRSLELYDQTSDNPFAQPVQVFSNIQNGFGIFAGTEVYYFHFDL